MCKILAGILGLLLGGCAMMDIMIKDGGDGGDIVFKTPTRLEVLPSYQYSSESLTTMGGAKFARATTVGKLAVFAPRDADFIVAYDRENDIISQSAPHLQGDNAYWGAATVGDWAVFAPRTADKVLAFNPSTGEMRFSGTYSGGESPYSPVEIVAVGEWAVFAPSSDTAIYSFNPLTGELRRDAHTEGLSAFLGAVRVGGLVVFSPGESASFVAYNPETRAIQYSSPHGLGAYPVNGGTAIGTLAVFAPGAYEKVVMYDPIGNTVSESTELTPVLGTFLEATAVGNWAVFSPYGASDILAYNVDTDEFKYTVGESIGYLGYSDASTVGNWAVFAPRNATRVRAYNPESGEVRRGDILEGTNNFFWGSTTVEDWVVFSPYSSGKVLAYNPEIRRGYTTDNADLYPDLGIGTAVYLSLFDAPTWNSPLETASEKISGLGGFEPLLNAPIQAGSIQRIKDKAESLLQWLVSDGVCSSVSVAVRNPRLGYVELDITATEPNMQRSRFKVLWNREEQKLAEFMRDPDRQSVVAE